MVDCDEYKKGHADMAFVAPCFLLKEKVSVHLVDVISTVIYTWSHLNLITSLGKIHLIWFQA